MPTLSFRGPTTPVTEFAFGELRKFFDHTPSLHNLRDIQFGVLAGDRDAFEFRLLGTNRLQVLAANDRSCLYAAYALLEAVGWRFPAPGEDHLDERALKPSAWKQLAGRTEASFEWRGLSVVNSDNDELEAVIDWMPKLRLNSIFIGHTGNLDQARALQPEWQRRGLRLETGGHILKSFLPAELFARNPEYFRMQDGARRPDGNFCTSRFGTLQVVADHALQYARELPAANVFHFWGHDAQRGSWCACPLCEKLAPAEQMLAAINAIAAALAHERPRATVDFLLYHDTLEIPVTLKPAPNAFACFAPRERCYAHGIGDPNCPHNAWYAGCLEAARKVFGLRLSVLEYYADFILWRGLGVATPATILADLEWYRSKGLEQIQALHFGKISNWLYPLNAYAFARAAWDAGLKHDTIVTQFSHARYAEHARVMLPVLAAIEQASVNTLTYCGYDRHAYDLRDPPRQPVDFVQQHITRVEEAIAQTETALAKLPAADSRAIQRDRSMLELNRDNLRALAHQMRSEYDAGITLLADLRQRLIEAPATLSGAWQTFAPNQFQMIAELLQSAKEGSRTRNW